MTFPRRNAAPLLLATLALAVALMPHAAWAAGTQGMPWEGPLDQLLRSLSGPVARVLGAVAIMLTGIAMAFSEGGSNMRKVLWVVLGLSITFTATTWGISFLGFGGGLHV